MNRPRALRTTLLAACTLCLTLAACMGQESGKPAPAGGDTSASETLPPIETPLPTPRPTPEPGFVLNLMETELYGGGVCQLIAFNEPYTRESRTVTWSSSDPAIAYVEDYGVVVGLKAGEAVITADANNGTGLTAHCMITVTSDRPAPRDYQLYKNTFRDGKRTRRAELAPAAETLAQLNDESAGDRFALSVVRYLGYPYGTGPDNLDCSMLLLYTSMDNGLLLPRRSDWQAQTLEAHTVDKADLQPGDFLFFSYHAGEECTCSTRPRCKRYRGIHHAAVYLGQNGEDRYLCDASSAFGRVVIRWWDGSDEYADMQLTMCVRPADAL